MKAEIRDAAMGWVGCAEAGVEGRVELGGEEGGLESLWRRVWRTGGGGEIPFFYLTSI